VKFDASFSRRTLTSGVIRTCGRQRICCERLQRDCTDSLKCGLNGINIFAQSTSNLVDARRYSLSLREVGKVAEAEAMLRDIMRSLEMTGAQNSPFGLETAAILGYTVFLEARYDEAIAILRSTLERQRSILGERYGPTLNTMRYLGSALRDKGDLAGPSVCIARRF
jgi:hypothetical protein